MSWYCGSKFDLVYYKFIFIWLLFHIFLQKCLQMPFIPHGLCLTSFLPNRLKLYTTCELAGYLWAGSYVWVLCWFLYKSKTPNMRVCLQPMLYKVFLWPYIEYCSDVLTWGRGGVNSRPRVGVLSDCLWQEAPLLGSSPTLFIPYLFLTEKVTLSYRHIIHVRACKGLWGIQGSTGVNKLRVNRGIQRFTGVHVHTRVYRGTPSLLPQRVTG